MASNGLDDCILAKIDEVYDEILDLKDYTKRQSLLLQKKLFGFGKKGKWTK